MGAQPISVLVVDDHQLVAEALALFLGSQPDFASVNAASSPEQALRFLQQHQVDVVALDLDLAGEDGLRLGREIAARWPDMALVIVTEAEDASRLLEAVGIGARGWVSKEAQSESLVSALQGAARGETHLPAETLQRMVVNRLTGGRNGSAATEAVERLGRREREVLLLMMQAMTRRQMGEELHVSPNTVRSHASNIFQKLEVHSTVAAAALAQRGGVGEEREPLTSGTSGQGLPLPA
jgi:DNA-binding NarL/FixJ family response regulator